MNRTLLALMMVLCSVASAQVEVVYPYNPDGNADSVISAPDLLDLLPIFGGQFTPQEITVNGEGLSIVLEEMQSALDSLSTITNGTTAFGEKVFLDFDSMKWTMDTWEAAVFEPSTDGFLEVIPQGDQTLSLHVLVIPEELDPCAGVYDDCTFLPWTFWYSDDLSNYQYGTDHPHTIPVKQSELVYVGSGNGDIDGVGVDFKWTPLLSSSNENSNPSEEANGPCQGELTVNYHGYDYELVEIGDQCWFAENLRATFYNNGDEIPQLNGGLQWATTSQGACCVYNEDPVVLLTSGRLYNWHATQDPRGLCPANWHVPSNSDFVTCLNPYDMASDAHALKASVFDVPQWNGTNESGFSALPSGMRMFNDGDFGDETNTGFWTASTSELSGYAIRLTLSQNQSYIMLQSRPYGDGHAIRCIKDQ